MDSKAVWPDNWWKYFPKHQWIKLFSCIDDAAIFSSLLEEHPYYNVKFLISFREIALKVYLRKCDIEKNSIKYLSHIIETEKHSADHGKEE